VKGSARARFFVGMRCGEDSRDLVDWDWGLQMESTETYPSSSASRVRANIFECEEGNWVLAL
jgi:hypothetical protein